MLVLLVLSALAAIQLVHYYPDLPGRLAVHFGPSGQPNRWDAKGSFYLFYGGIEALFLALGLATVLLIDRLPVRLTNIPHREYWFVGKRREESLDALTDYILWYDNLTLAFLIAIAELLFRANLAPGPVTLPRSTWTVMIVFVAAVVAVTVGLYRRFRPPQV